LQLQQLQERHKQRTIERPNEQTMNDSDLYSTTTVTANIHTSSSNGSSTDKSTNPPLPVPPHRLDDDDNNNDNSNNQEPQQEPVPFVAYSKQNLEHHALLRNHIDFLRQEAIRIEFSAKRLRELANILESGSSIKNNNTNNNSNNLRNDHGGHLPDDDLLVPSSYEAAPLDENGFPKYKGKKRGRKPKKRLRRRNPNAKKRAHTAYTLVSTWVCFFS
jgi:hypothetical protein